MMNLNSGLKFYSNDIINMSSSPAETSEERTEFSNYIAFLTRQTRLESDWIKFVKKEVIENFEPYFSMWIVLGVAHRSLLLKMEQLAKKHFRGILTTEALTRLQIFVKHLIYGIRALDSAVKEKMTLEQVLDFVEAFSKESLGSMRSWNWVLTEQDMKNLVSYTEEDLKEEEDAPPFDRSTNNGFPSWVSFKVCDSNCECCFTKDEEKDKNITITDKPQKDTSKNTTDKAAIFYNEEDCDGDCDCCDSD